MPPKNNVQRRRACPVTRHTEAELGKEAAELSDSLAPGAVLGDRQKCVKTPSMPQKAKHMDTVPGAHSVDRGPRAPRDVYETVRHSVKYDSRQKNRWYHNRGTEQTTYSHPATKKEKTTTTDAHSMALPHKYSSLRKRGKQLDKTYSIIFTLWQIESIVKVRKLSTMGEEGRLVLI